MYIYIYIHICKYVRINKFMIHNMYRYIFDINEFELYEYIYICI